MTTLFRTLLALVLALPSLHVSAATFCVSNSAQLNDALAAASANGESNAVRIQPGLYSRVEGFRATVEGTRSLDISGGWTSPACQNGSQTPVAGATVLSGLANRRVLNIETLWNHTGSIRLANLMLRAGRNDVDQGGCLRIWANDSTGNSDVLVERVELDGCESTTRGGGGAFLFVTGRLTFRGNLVHHNTSWENGGGVAIWLRNAQSHAWIANNTISDNRSRVAGNIGGLSIAATQGSFRIENNIIWGNCDVVGCASNMGPFTAQDDVRIYDNLVAGLAVPVGSGYGNYGDDPRFVAMDDYHLAADSPGVDNGGTAPNAGFTVTDLDGSPRIQGGRVDLGAYESSDVILADGFDRSP